MRRPFPLLTARPRIARWLLCGSLLASLATVAFTCGATIGATRLPANPGATIQQGLQRIIQIRRQQVDRFRATGFTSHELAYVKNPQFDLLNAEAELAAARGDKDSATGKRREVVSLRQQFVREMQQRNDIAPTIQENALLDLYEAQFQLAQAEGRSDRAEENLQRIVNVSRQRMSRIQEFRRGQGNGPETDLAGEKAEIAVIEAQIRLARFQVTAQQVAARPAETTAPQQK